VTVQRILAIIDIERLLCLSPCLVCEWQEQISVIIKRIISVTALTLCNASYFGGINWHSVQVTIIIDCSTIAMAVW
jgi:hypothetical protein